MANYNGFVNVSFDAAFTDPEIPNQANLTVDFDVSCSDIYGGVPPEAMSDTFFQHVVDHLSTLPAFPGITENSRSLQAVKSWSEPHNIEFTPTEED